jgi:UDP:flavonoid glycosyltransferase YjiC (YdhE family)
MAGVKTILVSPLEWGLGHTVRVVPVIAGLVAQGHRVIIASDGRSLGFLRFRFPNLEWIRMPFYPVHYSGTRLFLISLLPQLPGILRAVRKNRLQTRQLVKEYSIDLIISDHRYGITAPGTPSVFITNQLWLKAPRGLHWGEWIGYKIHLYLLRRYSEIWLPDFPGLPNISGIQTHPPQLPAKARFIGPLSRFEGVVPMKPEGAEPPDFLVLLSGPEPQRTILEKLLVSFLSAKGKPAVMFRGMPPADPSGNPVIEQAGCITMISHARDPHILWYMKEAGCIICRPGNSTVTDLIVVGRSAILIPTPGHTEQEYVAAHLAGQGLFDVCAQDKIDTCLAEVRGRGWDKMRF